MATWSFSQALAAHALHPLEALRKSGHQSNVQDVESLYDARYPTSWYAVRSVRALRAGQCVPIHLFGRPWVLFRTMEGHPCIMERHCPHMGAPLDKGRVAGEHIECPFHQWRFNTRGECAHIPYDEKIPRHANAECLPVRERMGWLWVHHGGAPRFDPPHLDAYDQGGVVRRSSSITMQAHPLMILENATDVQHFKVIHGVRFTEFEITDQEEREHRFAYRVVMRWPRGRKQDEHVLTFEFHGATVILGHMAHNGHALGRFVASPTPTKEGWMELHLMALIFKLEGWKRVLNPLLVPLLARKIFAGVADDYEPVWKEMTWQPRRVLVRDDGLAQQFRRYYARHIHLENEDLQ